MKIIIQRVSRAKVKTNKFFNQLVAEFKKSKLKVESGIFGAKMEVELVNNGLVTIWFEF